MNVNAISIKPNSIIIVTLNSASILPSKRKSYADLVGENIRKALKNCPADVLVIWDDAIKNITIATPEY